MGEIVRDWVMNLSVSALICAMLTEICPKGAVKRVVKAICGIVMALALLSPLPGLSLDSYGLNAAKYRERALAMEAEGEEISQRLSRTIIEEEMRAYILDKGSALGAEVRDARVTLRWSSEGYWYPVECELFGEYSPELEGAIRAELGVTVRWEQ